MATYNIELNYFNGSSYDILIPKTSLLMYNGFYTGTGEGQLNLNKPNSKLRYYLFCLAQEGGNVLTSFLKINRYCENYMITNGITKLGIYTSKIYDWITYVYINTSGSQLFYTDGTMEEVTVQYTKSYICFNLISTSYYWLMVGVE